MRSEPVVFRDKNGTHCAFAIHGQKAPGLAEYRKRAPDRHFKILHHNGVYVGECKTGGQVFVLFQLYGFAVEVFYKQYRRQTNCAVSTDNATVL